MRKIRSTIALLVLPVLAVSAFIAPSAAAPLEVSSPSGEIVVVTVNAAQIFEPSEGRLTALAAALRERPVTAAGSYYAPDVIVVNEIPAATLTAFAGKLNGLFEPSVAEYGIVGATSDDAKAKLLINKVTMYARSFSTWIDVCDSARRYQLVNLTEKASAKTVTVAGIHFNKNYGSGACRGKNALEVRKQIAAQDTSGSVVGDFNRRAMKLQRECDPEETSDAEDWYTKMTAFSTIDSRTYIDTVRSYHRANHQTMFHEWTHEWTGTSDLCDDSTGYRRNRIDYIFVSDTMSAIEAHADHPGWAAQDLPGSLGCATIDCKYSDHRFTWALVDMIPTAPAPAPDPTPTAPAAPSNVTATAESSTSVTVGWSNVADESGYRLERLADDQTTWLKVADLGPDVTSHVDNTVTASTTYHYRVIAWNAVGDSAPSATASATTPGPDLTAPTAPGDLTAKGTKGRIDLTWTASADLGGSGVAHYKIYRSSNGTDFVPHAEVAGSSTSYRDTSVVKNATYWYFVTAIDGAGNQSDPSGTASAKVR